MKKAKVLLILACAVLLVAASVMGTLAYLTSTDKVENTFTVGQVHIQLDEARVDENGKALTGEKAERVAENTYNLLPGHEYDKDPTVTVLKGSSESYIRMVVTVNKAAELDRIFAAHELSLTEVVTGYSDSEWTLHGTSKNAEDNTRTYEFYYKNTVSAKSDDVKLPALFTGINVPGALTNDELKMLQYAHTGEDDEISWGAEEKLSITVTAYAIQADGFDDAEDAWSHFPNP